MSIETGDIPKDIGAVISTIENRCKRCYSCIRNCPANAIKVDQGQARVMAERCVACGYCVRVCSQNAKRIQDGIVETEAMLKGADPVVLVIAPSFPVAFHEFDPDKVVAAAKELGFAKVVEVAFGAELVGMAYRKLLEKRVGGPIIASPCPSVVNYIEKFHPSLVPYLAPIVSPMVAVARAVKQKYLPGSRVVFVGPCVAKKQECADPAAGGDIDAVLTFDELRQMLLTAGIDPVRLDPVPFDGPAPYLGRIFPVSGGLLRTAALEADVLNDDVVVTEGRGRVLDVLNSIEMGNIKAKFFDLLFCEGCINGPVMPRGMGLVAGKEMVSSFLREHARTSTDKAEFWKTLEDYAGIDLSRAFADQSIKLEIPTEEQINALLAQINKSKPEDELNCGACGYRSCREKAIAVFQGLAENEMCLPFIIDQLIVANEQVNDAQKQLFRAEKLASIGRLAAGIAHEINNPLGGILLFANILGESLGGDKQKQQIKTIIDETIRCREIVKGVLDFSRQTEPRFEPLDIVSILDRVFDLIEKQVLFQNIDLKKPYKDRAVSPVHGDLVQLQQVLVNIIVNAAQAITDSGIVAVDVGEKNGFVEITVSDTGCGIAEDALDKIYEPFYTTKGPRKGTGLGLSTSHGIIAKHNGSIMVESMVGQGSTFKIRLPAMERK